ncbi:kinesin light [Colletotrichum kahawae]|uniref:Kinesin light n=1 Tax=Colletotrichum kahawae TaxID=34407 RepID=A0AAD9YRT0_COLKA|nr:kinesin light [Colletotrichum kahawae]
MSTINRAKDDDSKSRRCTFLWPMYSAAFTGNGLILVRHKEGNSFERVPVDNTTGVVALPEDSMDSLVVSGYHQANLYDLAPEEQTKPCRLDLPERYYRAFKAGETYSLVFPGTEVGMWAWGSIEDNKGLEMKAGKLLSSGYRSRPRAKKGQGQARLVVPGGVLLTFTAVDEQVTWPEREAREAEVGFSAANSEEQIWRMSMQQAESHRRNPEFTQLGSCDRVLGAPIFSTTLQCPATIQGRAYFDVEVIIKYEGTEGPSGQQTSNAQPVTFHWLSLISGQGPDKGFELYRRRGEVEAGGRSNVANDWDLCHIEETSAGFMVVDDPDITVCVGKHKHFTALQPGETWTTIQTLSGNDAELPRDMVVGDIFRYTFKGAEVDWWDWGTMEDHTETEVKLPCYEAGNVTNPSDNGGRPKLVVPGATPVKFTVVQ